MAAPGARRKISASSARAHTRKSKQKTSFKIFPGVFTTVSLIFLVGILAWAYQIIQPPPPKICGSPGGPHVTSPRIKLRDGRHLAYKEHGVPKETANYKIIYVHGTHSCRHDFPDLPQEFAKELGIYVVSFDRPGYGESDPNTNRTVKCTALDIEELADQLGLGSKFYVMGHSMGGQAVWGCLKHIPHRLLGAALLTPVVNHWWPGFPANLSKEVYEQQLVQDQWALRVAHYTPWLTYWWNTQKFFPGSAVLARKAEIYSEPDRAVIPKLVAKATYRAQITQQGEFESLHRDLMVGFGKWEFDPMDLENPFPNNEGSVHIWQGDQDLLVPVTLQRYIAEKLPWIQYHELKETGHLFPLADGMFKIISLVLLVGIVAWAYQAIQPPPPTICGSPGGPPVTGPRIQLGDGRYLAYKEHGVPKEKANYKIVYVHGFLSCRHDFPPLPKEFAEELGIYVVSFDRAGYGESDPNPNMTVKSFALDIEELADQLGLGSKFYVVGYSMGGQVIWTCIKYIPHRLLGATLLAPVVNYWWPGFPANLSKQVYNQQLVQDQWALRVAHYTPWLTYWWNTQKWFPGSAVAVQKLEVFSQPDRLLLPKFAARKDYEAQIKQQGEFESLHRDMMIGFGKWEFDPMDLENPFPNNEGSVHLWQGDQDLLVPVTLQRYIVQKLPWIQYHELPETGHMFPIADGMVETFLRPFLLGK